jgi:hypothetical protein
MFRVEHFRFVAGERFFVHFTDASTDFRRWKAFSPPALESIKPTGRGLQIEIKFWLIDSSLNMCLTGIFSPPETRRRETKTSCRSNWILRRREPLIGVSRINSLWALRCLRCLEEVFGPFECADCGGHDVNYSNNSCRQFSSTILFLFTTFRGG